MAKAHRPNIMRGKLNKCWLLFIVLALLSASLIGAEIDADPLDDSSDSSSEDEEDGVIEQNPHYVGSTPSGNNEDSSDDGDSDSDGEGRDEEDGKEGGKTVINKALSKSRRNTSRSVGFIRKHRKAITFVLVIFAFRREIWKIVSSLATEVTPSGEKKMRRIPLSPTSILKILLFIDIMRKIQSSSDGGQPSPLPATALLGGSSGILGSLLLEFLHPANPAYIPPIEQHYTFERINERYTKDVMALRKALTPPRSPLTGVLGARKKRLVRNSFPGQTGSNAIETIRADSERQYTDNTTAIVLDFTALDSSVSQIDVVRDEVSFLLSQHRTNVEDAKRTASKANNSSCHENFTAPELEVILLLESPGGSASDYGLAASQIGRLRDEPGITVTVCVDKVAASGGYMIACQSSPGHLYAAPFAVVGSIGVIGQALNIHNALQNWGVKPLVFRGGKDKAPVGVIGEVTKEGIAKVQNMVDKTHDAFKRHVTRARPGMARHIEKVATGDVWLGCDALDVGLVDRIVTSDEYIGEKIKEGVRVLKLIRHTRRGIHLFGSAAGRRNPLIESGSDVRRILSKFADVLEDFPGRSEDIAVGASSRSAIALANKESSLRH